MFLNQVLAGQLTATQAAEHVDISLRQLRRLLASYKAEGADALAHGNRGRKPAVAFSEETRASVLACAALPEYAGCNDQHLSELLAERDGLVVSRSTLRRWLRQAGRPSPQQRRAPRHRKLRQRSARRGMLIQIDTSFHPWFEDRGGICALIGAIDDATGELLFLHFQEQEDTDGYFRMLRHMLLRDGIPMAFYHDGRSTFKLIRSEPTRHEQLTGQTPQTQFGRACEELGITLIHAQSAQAKGRVERAWRTLQDRLRICLRLEGIANPEAANHYLPQFIARHNAQFAVQPTEPESAFLAPPKNLNVDGTCCVHHQRIVTGDNTVQIHNQRLQLPPGPKGRSHKGAHVAVQERLDGTWGIYQGEVCLAYPAPMAAPRPPKATLAPTAQTDPSLDPAPASKPTHRPAKNHPWRTGFPTEPVRHTQTVLTG